MGILHKIQTKHNLILKILLVFCVSFIFTLLLPTHSVNFHKADEFDAIWPYKDLEVDEDLFIKKTVDELEDEKKKLVAQSPLIFTIETEERNEKLEKLRQLINKDAKTYLFFKSILDSVYKVGIIQSIDGNIATPVLIEADNEAKYSSYSDYFTIQSALSFIEKKLQTQNKNNFKPEEFLAITIYFNKLKTENYTNSLLNNISVYKVFYADGDKIIKQGEALTKAKRDLINLYFNKKNSSGNTSGFEFIGRFGVMFILNLTLLSFLYFFRKNVFAQNKQVMFLYLCLFVAFFSSYFFYKYGLMQNALPFALIPILVRVFFDSRTALFTHLMALIICSFFMPDKIEFLLLQLITGIGILFFISEMRKRQQIMSSALIAMFFYCALFMFYNLGFGTKLLITKFSAYLPYLISGGLVLLATPLIFISEKIFSFVSDFKLLELCDLNNPLLRQLSQEIPGTFQHSLQVANLAEEAIYYIGGNTLLVRAGAMYHDVGKINNPSYYIENQGSNTNPHLEMLPKESARVIINHVIEGVELAKKHKLPELIIDFIRTHHGTTTVGFFLNMEKTKRSDLNINEDDFKYPGPIPFSKETAVLMLADGVEAASRSLKTHDALSINDLVDNIINYKINQNQLINADITFKDITIIRKIFKKRLMTIYHARIEYPV